MLFDLERKKKTVTIDVDIEAMVEAFRNHNISIDRIQYLLFDEEIAYRLLKIAPDRVWHSLPDTFKEKREFILLFINAGMADFINTFKSFPQYSNDEEIVVSLLKHCQVHYVGAVLYIDKSLLTSPSFVLENIEYTDDLYTLSDDYYINHKLTDSKYLQRRKSIDNSNIRDNFEVTLKAVTLYGYTTYQFASERLKANKEIVLALLKKEPDAYFKLEDSLKENPIYIKIALKGNADIFKILDEEKRKCFDYAIIAIKESAYLFKYADVKLRANPEFVAQSFDNMEMNYKRENVFYITNMELATDYFRKMLNEEI